MVFWLVRAGRHGEQEQAALEHVATIVWTLVKEKDEPI